MKLTKDSWIKRCNNAHNNFYDYSLVHDFLTNKDKVKIICPKHGVFEQRVNNHFYKGCSKCRSSHSEKLISNFLTSQGYIFEEQKKFQDCISINPLPFDFYIPIYNLVIEYNGEHHYYVIPKWGQDKYEKTLKHDKIKKEYCLEKDIKYLEIPFWVDTLKVLQNCLIHLNKSVF